MIRRKYFAIVLMAAFLLNIFSGGLASADPKKAVNTTVTIDPDGRVTIVMQFNDLKDFQWAMKDISKMQLSNVIKGYQDGSFKPNKPVTQLEAVVMAVRLMGQENGAVVSDTVYNGVYLPFADSNKIDSWAKGYVALALEKKIIESNTGNFQPNKPASRLWVSVLLTKALGLQAEADAKKSVQLTFKDANAIPADLVGYVAVAVEKGLVKGFTDNTFQPNKPVTRAEMAALLGRSDDQIVDVKSKAKGIVKAITSSSITIAKEGVSNSVYGQVYNGQETFPIDPQVKVFLGEQKASLADVMVGSKVYLRLVNGVVAFIEVKTNEIEGKVVAKSVYGVTVEGYDEDEDEDDEDYVFHGDLKVTSRTQIKLQGKANATIDDVLIGDKIEAKVVGEEALVIKIEGRKVKEEKKIEKKEEKKDKHEDKKKGKGHSAKDDDDEDDED